MTASNGEPESPQSFDAKVDDWMKKFERWRKQDDGKRGKKRVVKIRVLAYWPAEEWDAMAARWPQFVPEYGDDHETHRRNVQDMLQAHSEQTDATLGVAYMSVKGLEDYAGEHGVDPALSETRAAYAQFIGSERLAVPWPPAGRVKCWCGSGLKYRECCDKKVETPAKG